MQKLFIVLTFCLMVCGSSQAKSKMNVGIYGDEPDMETVLDAPVWKTVKSHVGFYAPWSGKTANNVFQCYFSDHYFYFRFIIEDSTLLLKKPFTKKLDVTAEDRAEIFLSATPDLKQYYCAEMDPQGKVLDYSAQFQRKFNYSWSFETLQLKTRQTKNGYMVAGRWSLKEWQKLGIHPNHFYMGVFSADFYFPEEVIWFSLLKVNREKADFHIPVMLFPCRSKVR